MFPVRPALRPIAAAALLVLTAAACAPAAGSSSPAPAAAVAASLPASSSAAATPDAGVAFASERHGYRLTMPPGWTVTETPGNGGLHPDEPGVDTFRDTVGHILSVTRDPAPSLANWTCPIARHLEGDHGLVVESTEAVAVAGLPARLLEYHLHFDPYVTHYLTTELVDGGRGMTLSLESTTGRDDEDRRILDGMLSSVELPKAG